MGGRRGAAAGVFSQHGGLVACGADLNMRRTWPPALRRAPGTPPIIFQTSPAMSHSDTIDRRPDTGKGGNSEVWEQFFTPRLSPAVDT